MIQRSTKNRHARIIIGTNLSLCQRLVDEGKVTSLSRQFMRERLSQALRYARRLPDNPGNRAIRASIVAALEALNQPGGRRHDA